MPITYAEFLKAEGASEDDIKLLNTPIAQKAFDKQQAIAVAAKQKSDELIEANRKWAEQVETQNQAYLKERDSAKIDAAAAQARIAKMGELGLIEVAERLEPGSTKPEAKTTPNDFDPSKYVTSDTLMQVAEREGDAIAIAQDISFEHQQLFGGDATKRLNFRELRREAVSRKMPVESLWMEKYGVQAARDARAAKERADHENRIASEAVTKYKSEHVNPLTTAPVISSTPFTGRVISEGKAATHPWQQGEATRENARVAKVMDTLSKQGTVQ